MILLDHSSVCKIMTAITIKMVNKVVLNWVVGVPKLAAS